MCCDGRHASNVLSERDDLLHDASLILLRCLEYRAFIRCFVVDEAPTPKGRNPCEIDFSLCRRLY